MNKGARMRSQRTIKATRMDTSTRPDRQGPCENVKRQKGRTVGSETSEQSTKEDEILSTAIQVARTAWLELERLMSGRLIVEPGTSKSSKSSAWTEYRGRRVG